MSKHTPTPWDPRGYDERYGPIVLETPSGKRIADFVFAADRDRAQAAVNALAGIDDPAAFVKAVDELLSGFRKVSAEEFLKRLEDLYRARGEVRK